MPHVTFEDRQKQWTGAHREFRQHHGRNERPTVWEIEVKGNRVFTRAGLLDGAMQDTNYVGKTKNVGKKNEIDADTDAMAEARRDCRKKWDFEGFDEYVNGKNVDNRHEDMTVKKLLSGQLPGSFCLYKPKNELDSCKGLLAKAQAGQVLYALKRDGLAFWVVQGYDDLIHFYSRRSRPWCDREGPTEMLDGTLNMATVVPWVMRFPHLLAAIQKLSLPPGTMLACELVAPGGKDRFRYVSGLTKGHTPRALQDMAKGGLPQFYIWDVPFFNGEDLLASQTVKQRYARIQQIWTQAAAHPLVQEHLQPIQFMSFKSPEEATEYAKAQKIEGFVVVDPTAIYGDRGWSLKGKPDRPPTAAKCKPRGEDDFIAMWDEDDAKQQGSGKHERGKLVTLPDGKQVVHGGVGSVALFQCNSRGKLIPICTCASGMDYAFQAKLTKKSFPFVCQVEFLSRTYISDGEKTNALRNPVFLRVRDDKHPEECVNEALDEDN